MCIACLHRWLAIMELKFVESPTENYNLIQMRKKTKKKKPKSTTQKNTIQHQQRRWYTRCLTMYWAEVRLTNIRADRTETKLNREKIERVGKRRKKREQANKSIQSVSKWDIRKDGHIGNEIYDYMIHTVIARALIQNRMYE